MNPSPASRPPVRLAFSPDPAYVRTVRLIAAAVARRTGVADRFLDEIRLATGEACSRAVAVHRRYGLTDMINVVITGNGAFTVSVTDRGGEERAAAVDHGSDDDAEFAAEMGLTLLAGLVSDLEVGTAPDGQGTEVRMSWPVRRRVAG